MFIRGGGIRHQGGSPLCRGLTPYVLCTLTSKEILRRGRFIYFLDIKGELRSINATASFLAARLGKLRYANSSVLPSS